MLQGAGGSGRFVNTFSENLGFPVMWPELSRDPGLEGRWGRKDHAPRRWKAPRMGQEGRPKRQHCTSVYQIDACMHAKSLCNPMDSSPPCSSVHGILQARILEWAAISFSLSNRKRALVNPGAVLRETPRVLQRPQGQGSPGYHCSPRKLCIQSIWLCARHQGSEAATASSAAADNPGPGGGEARHMAPPQRGAARVCRGRRAGGPYLWGRPDPSEPAAAAVGLPPWAPSLPRPLLGPRLAGTTASASRCWGWLETLFPSLFYTQCPRNNILLICN